jgi:hypothetical protein
VANHSTLWKHTPSRVQYTIGGARRQESSKARFGEMPVRGWGRRESARRFAGSVEAVIKIANVRANVSPSWRPVASSPTSNAGPFHLPSGGRSLIAAMIRQCQMPPGVARHMIVRTGAILTDGDAPKGSRTLMGVPPASEPGDLDLASYNC